MNQIECLHRGASSQQTLKPSVQVDDKYVATEMAVTGSGIYSNAICLLLARELNPVPFCKAPSHSDTNCPVALFYNKAITYERANELLDKAYGKP